MTDTWHPDESQLVPLVDGELRSAEAERLERHVARCAECREKVAGYRTVYGAYRSAIRTASPPPPEPWADLRDRFHELDAGRVLSRRQPSFRINRRWMAVAASVLIGVVAFRLMTDTTVSAAELLRNASAAEVRATSPKKIRVKTRKAIYTRPATRGTESELELAALFRRANYNWEEPLSARSFAAWRDSLPAKDDAVRLINDTEWGRGRFYRITTSAPSGELAEASITIRAADMRAVHEHLKFRNDEWVEITEAVEVDGPLTAPLPPAQIAEQPRETRQAVTAADELKVVAALHAIGADLGDPVEVTRETERIVVSALASDPERQAQIRSALSGLRGVDLRFEQPEAVRTEAPTRRAAEAEAPKSNELIERLAAQLGSRNTVENFTNHVMDLSEAALARAHALRALAVRFAPDVEAELSESDRATLHSIQQDHTKHLLASVRQLNEVIRPVAKQQGSSGGVEFGDWQTGTASVLQAAQAVDKTITNALAGTGRVEDPDGALRHLSAAAVDLNARVAALQTVFARAGGRQ